MRTLALLLLLAGSAFAQTSTFTGYSGGGCSSNPSCVINLTANTQVNAAFNLNLTGTFTLLNPPPPAWAAGLGGTGSLYNQKIPASPRCWAAGSNGVNQSNCATAQAMAKQGLTQGGCSGPFSVGDWNCGLISIPKAGVLNGGNSSADTQSPKYYCDASCPWFKLTQLGLNVFFHAPSGAIYGGGPTGDQQIEVYDTAQNIVVAMYGFNKGLAFSIGTSTCSGSGPSTCAVAVSSVSGYAAHPYGLAPDYNRFTTYSVAKFPGYVFGQTIGSGSPSAGAGQISFAELAAGSILHAMAFNPYCQNPSTPASAWPFPATPSSGFGTCPQGANPNEPLPSMMYANDYTAAQIAAMPIGNWQKAILLASSIGTGYGMYADQGGGSSSFTGHMWANNELESQTAYQHMGVSNPSLPKMCSDTGWQGCVADGGIPGSGSAFGRAWANIPRLVGTIGGTDNAGNSCANSPGCYPSGHWIVIDQCTVKTMAGVGGGC